MGEATRSCELIENNGQELLDCDYYRRWSGRSQSVAVRDDHLMAGQDLGAYTGYRPDSCIKLVIKREKNYALSNVLQVKKKR